jgi:hypothetical protein
MKTSRQNYLITKIVSKMKTKMKYLVGMALFLFIAMGVNAQVSVPIGSQKNYHVTNHAGYNYQWSISDATAGTITNGTTAASTIEWSKVGTYTLTLTETNASSALCGTPNTLSVTVLGAPTLQFTAATSASCANAAQDLALTIVGATDASQYPITVTYTVDGGVAQTLTLATLAATKAITLDATVRADIAAFTPTRDFVVVITGATTVGGGTVTLGAAANLTHTNTVYDIPDANAIIAD